MRDRDKRITVEPDGCVTAVSEYADIGSELAPAAQNNSATTVQHVVMTDPNMIGNRYFFAITDDRR